MPLLSVIILGHWSCCECETEPTDLVSIDWVQIPSGTFTMGSPLNELEWDARQSPQQIISISSFRMSKFEITFDQFDTFCEVTGRSKPNDEGRGRGNRPVINVSWEDAVAFAGWLGPGYRLPTEAEWEYACRAGITKPFYTGDCLSTISANFNGGYPYSGCVEGQYLAQTIPVGSYASNAFGLHDMHGNVWEWCSDWFEYYSGSTQINPTGPISGSTKIVRGGSWSSTGGNCRSTFRESHVPTYRDFSIGFRLVVPN